MLKKRLINWVFIDILFSLLPLIMAIVIRLIKSFTIIDCIPHIIPELLFFSLIISVTTVNDIKMVSFDNNLAIKFLICEYLLFFGMAFSSILYGFFLRENLNGNAERMACVILFRISLAIAFFILMISSKVQFQIAKFEE